MSACPPWSTSWRENNPSLVVVPVMAVMMMPIAMVMVMMAVAMMMVVMMVVPLMVIVVAIVFMVVDALVPVGAAGVVAEDQ